VKRGDKKVDWLVWQMVAQMVAMKVERLEA
jgi:hypothetical protein